MLEDLLTHEERVRLECLALSASYYRDLSYASDALIERAKDFEKYIIGEGYNG